MAGPCRHCGAEWKSRVENPIQCPRCCQRLAIPTKRGVQIGSNLSSLRSPVEVKNVTSSESVLAVQEVRLEREDGRRSKEHGGKRDAGTSGRVDSAPDFGFESTSEDVSCGFEAYNDQDGETYRCCLPAHGSKVKHG